MIEVHVLDVRFNHGGVEDTLYPVILQSGEETILVDCGYSGFMPLIENAASQHGLSLRDLTGIIITHHDVDHVGGLYEIRQEYPAIKIYASETEADRINGKEKSLRLVQAESMYEQLPDEHKPGAAAFQEMLKSVRPVDVDHVFPSGQGSTYLGGIKVIETPGHMPGHISLYIPENKTLIAADALVYENGELEIANPHFTLDLKQAVDSVKMLQQLEINRLVCYHGGTVEHDIEAKLTKLLAKYPDPVSV